MSRQFFSGNSIEQAVMAAARHHGIEPEKVAYTTRDKKHGFLNIRRRVVIEVDPEQPQLSDEDRSPQAEAPASPPAKTRPKAPPALESEEDGHGDLEDDEDDEDFGDEDSDDEDSDDEESDDEDSDDEDSDDEETGTDTDADDDFDEELDEEDESEDPDDADSDDEDSDDEDSDDEDADEEDDRAPRGRGSRGEGRRGRQGGGTSSRSRKQDPADGANVRMHRGVKVDWKDEVELEGVSRELAAFEFAVEQILDVMDLEIEYTIVEGETYKIEFSGEDADLLTEDDGRVLKAFEHVLPRIVRGLVGDTLNCKVDCEGFRAEHEDKLVELAQEAADEVRESGDSKVLPQMNPSDRRIIHLALVNDPDVETVSQGRGYMKRVRIQLLEED